MSFSGNTKASVSAMPPERDCCAAAELRALLSYASSFDENGVKFITETPEVSDIFTSLLLVCADVTATPEMKENKTTSVYKTEITDSESLSRLFALFGGKASLILFHLFLPCFAFGLGLRCLASLIFGILFFQEIVGHSSGVGVGDTIS